jgi:hypothetical protein
MPRSRNAEIYHGKSNKQENDIHRADSFLSTDSLPTNSRKYSGCCDSLARLCCVEPKAPLATAWNQAPRLSGAENSLNSNWRPAKMHILAIINTNSFQRELHLEQGTQNEFYYLLLSHNGYATEIDYPVTTPAFNFRLQVRWATPLARAV